MTIIHITIDPESPAPDILDALDFPGVTTRQDSRTRIDGDATPELRRLAVAAEAGLRRYQEALARVNPQVGAVSVSIEVGEAWDLAALPVWGEPYGGREVAKELTEEETWE